jgi:hypothetical protein
MLAILSDFELNPGGHFRLHAFREAWPPPGFFSTRPATAYSIQSCQSLGTRGDGAKSPEADMTAPAP